LLVYDVVAGLSISGYVAGRMEGSWVCAFSASVDLSKKLSLVNNYFLVKTSFANLAFAFWFE
jgi:hypothetical protein